MKNTLNDDDDNDNSDVKFLTSLCNSQSQQGSFSDVALLTRNISQIVLIFMILEILYLKKKSEGMVIEGISFENRPN